MRSIGTTSIIVCVPIYEYRCEDCGKRSSALLASYSSKDPACPHCGKPVDIFGHGEGAKTARAYGVPVLGEIEIDPRIRIGGDTGKPVALLGERALGAKSMYDLARAVTTRLDQLSGTASGPSVQID